MVRRRKVQDDKHLVRVGDEGSTSPETLFDQGGATRNRREFPKKSCDANYTVTWCTNRSPRMESDSHGDVFRPQTNTSLPEKLNDAVFKSIQRRIRPHDLERVTHYPLRTRAPLLELVW